MLSPAVISYDNVHSVSRRKRVENIDECETRGLIVRREK